MYKGNRLSNTVVSTCETISPEELPVIGVLLFRGLPSTYSVSLKYRLDPAGRSSERSTASANASLLLLSKVVAVRGSEVIAINDSNLMATGKLGCWVLVVVLGETAMMGDVEIVEDG